MGLEAALDVVKDAVVLTGLPDGNDIHEAERVPVVTSFFVVNFDESSLVLANLDALLAGESILKTVLQQNGQRKAFTELVGAGGRACRVHTLKFV